LEHSVKEFVPEAIIMLLPMLVFIVAMGSLGVRANQSFKELVGLRIRTNQLANDLRKQKELAEQASLAKSTFLAAASHDLRQPVHALGMFVGALRGVSLPPNAVRLVDRFN
jgi:signal transduction histidine kinase